EKSKNFIPPIEEKQDSLRSIKSELAKQGATLTLISEDEYYAEKAKLTKKPIKELKSKDKLLKRASQDQYGTITKTETIVDSRGAKCQIRYGFKAKFYSSGSFHEYKEILGSPFVIATGSGDFTWEDAGESYAEIINNGWNVKFLASGVIKAEIGYSLSSSFKTAGFELSGSSHNKQIYRKWHSIQETF
ncbi:hypothetical protein G7A79_27920, partial [Coprococcus sp. MSK.21.13]|nr:hypothetical protein [Coprococcus sp. MSK.21.13]